mmetsp:Transcript_25272/g.52185  ORF Transcript_25272/g.52185 Transcript_25272/m.52185 type:complete len:335 (-) Transcript_25272:107-1111(-)
MVLYPFVQGGVSHHIHDIKNTNETIRSVEQFRNGVPERRRPRRRLSQHRKQKHHERRLPRRSRGRGDDPTRRRRRIRTSIGRYRLARFGPLAPSFSHYRHNRSQVQSPPILSTLLCGGCRDHCNLRRRRVQPTLQATATTRCRSRRRSPKSRLIRRPLHIHLHIEFQFQFQVFLLPRAQRRSNRPNRGIHRRQSRPRLPPRHRPLHVHPSPQNGMFPHHQQQYYHQQQQDPQQLHSNQKIPHTAPSQLGPPRSPTLPRPHLRRLLARRPRLPRGRRFRLPIRSEQFSLRPKKVERPRSHSRRRSRRRDELSGHRDLCHVGAEFAYHSDIHQYGE